MLYYSDEEARAAICRDVDFQRTREEYMRDAGFIRLRGGIDMQKIWLDEWDNYMKAKKIGDMESYIQSIHAKLKSVSQKICV